MENIKKKLKEEKPSEKGLIERIVNFFQKLFYSTPSSKKIHEKIQEIKNNKKKKIALEIAICTEIKTRLESDINIKSNSPVKAFYDDMAKKSGMILPKGKVRLRDETNLPMELRGFLKEFKENAEKIISQKSQKSLEGLELVKEDIKKIKEFETIISTETSAKGLLSDVSNQVATYLSNRSILMNRNLNASKRSLASVERELENLKERQKLVIHSKGDIDVIRNDLQNRIDEISKELSLLDTTKEPHHKSDFNNLTQELQEIMDLLAKNQEFLPEKSLDKGNVEPTLGERILYQSELENSKKTRETCLSIYERVPEFYEKLKAHMKMTSTGEKKGTVRQEIRNVIERLTDAKKEIRAESPMEMRLNKDIVYTINELKKINDMNETSFDTSFGQILEKMAIYFSNRLKEEKNDLAIIEDDVTANKSKILDLVEEEILRKGDMIVKKSYQDQLNTLDKEISEMKQKNPNDPDLRVKIEQEKLLRFIIKNIFEHKKLFADNDYTFGNKEFDDIDE